MESFPVRLDKLRSPELENSSRPESSIKEQPTAKTPVEEAKPREQALQLKSPSVVFQVDDHGAIYIEVVDKETGEVVRQIPPEELRRLAETMTELTGQILDQSV
jgi:flagellar protein FlaG